MGITWSDAWLIHRLACLSFVLLATGKSCLKFGQLNALLRNLKTLKKDLGHELDGVAV